MTRTAFAFSLVTACAALGFSMPSCPGNRAMQDQMDALEQKNAALSAKVQAMDTQMKALNENLGTINLTLEQTKKAMDAESGALTRMGTAVGDLQNRVAALAAAKPAKSSSKKKKH